MEPVEPRTMIRLGVVELMIVHLVTVQDLSEP